MTSKPGQYVAGETIERDRIALAVQQPWAELIVRGHKTVEIRSRSIQLRGVIYIYASKQPSKIADASLAARRFQIDSEAVPRGSIVGVVSVIGCRRAESKDAGPACVSQEMLTGKFAWELSQPVAFRRHLPVEHTPYGIWFYPFRPNSIASDL